MGQDGTRIGEAEPKPAPLVIRISEDLLSKLAEERVRDVSPVNLILFGAESTRTSSRTRSITG